MWNVWMRLRWRKTGHEWREEKKKNTVVLRERTGIRILVGVLCEEGRVDSSVRMAALMCIMMKKWRRRGRRRWRRRQISQAAGDESHSIPFSAWNSSPSLRSDIGLGRHFHLFLFRFLISLSLSLSLSLSSECFVWYFCYKTRRTMAKEAMTVSF